MLNLKHISSIRSLLQNRVLPDGEEEDQVDGGREPEHGEQDEERGPEVRPLVLPRLVLPPHLLVQHLLLPGLLPDPSPGYVSQ